MSAEAVGWVYRHSPYRGVIFAVHLAIADVVNDQHDNELWIKQERLAKKARASRKAVNTAIAEMRGDGFLEQLEEGGGRSRPARFRFLFPATSVVFESRNKTVTRGDSKASETVTPDDSNPRKLLPTVTGKEPKRNLTQRNSPNGAPNVVQQLVGTYIDACRAQGYEPTKRRISRVGSEIKRLLGDGHPESTVQGALRWIADENKTPASLEYLAAEIQKENHRGAG